MLTYGPNEMKIEDPNILRMERTIGQVRVLLYSQNKSLVESLDCGRKVLGKLSENR